jgi:hypothetical protein
MKTLLLFSLFASINTSASTVQCKYLLQGYPFADVSFIRNDDGTLGDHADVVVQGKMHKESLSTEPLGTGEYAHGWLSKESADNSVELTMYVEPQAQGQSKLTNHHVPFGQDVWGTCTVSLVD